MESRKIKAIIKKMTLEEKVSICSGSDFWHTQAIERLGIPEVMVSDGPHGLRKQDLTAVNPGVNNSIQAVCFPTGVSLAASFDEDLVFKVGEMLGRQCQAEGVGAILGPANNIKRSPLCGRNFEYFSEDPYLSGKIAAAHIRGVQSQGVGTSLKHFCANNQEFRRNSYDSIIDERTFREIYLRSFEIAVKESQPWTVMCSYNLVNGIQASENRRILTEILRDEWGFRGLVMSDWGAVRDRVRGIAAGLDLEMPSSRGAYDRLVIDAVNNNELSEKSLDICVERVLNFVFKVLENHNANEKWDKNRDHLISRDIAKECMVLLKNDNKILPVKNTDHLLFVGGFAKKPRFQGGGSSHINACQKDSMLLAVQGNPKVAYEEGFSSSEDKYDSKLVQRALRAAKDADKVIVFAGLPDSFESEGYDRTHMNLPDCQNRIIEEIAGVNPHVVVVLENGSPVTMPWLEKVEGVLETYLCGQGAGVATIQVLYGNSNPSGRLPETFPLKLSDNPSYLDFGGDCNRVEYREGIYVGYRYYTKKEIKVAFPFGYGLSYSDFSYGKMTVETDEMRDDETLEVTIDVRNESDVPGKEVVQLYVEADILNTKIRRAVRELKGFTKIFLEPGQKKTVSFILDKSAFAYFDTEINDWYVEPGYYKIEICKNAEEVITAGRVKVIPKKRKKVIYDENSIFKDILEDPKAAKIIKPYFDEYLKENITEQNSDEAAMEAFSGDGEVYVMDTPLRAMVNFGSGRATLDDLKELIERLNK